MYGLHGRLYWPVAVSDLVDDTPSAVGIYIDLVLSEWSRSRRVALLTTSVRSQGDGKNEDGTIGWIGNGSGDV